MLRLFGGLFLERFDKGAGFVVYRIIPFAFSKFRSFWPTPVPWRPSGALHTNLRPSPLSPHTNCISQNAYCTWYLV